VTQWVENPELGRERGPIAIGRAWAELLLRPRQFFRTKVAPGDQAPGLTFAAAVVLVAELTRMATVAGAYPVFGGRPAASALLWLLAVLVLVMPAGVHLTAAVQTLLLMAAVEERAGVSETVQVICYATAPCAFVHLPGVWVIPAPVIGAAAAVWGGALFVLGIATVHEVPVARAAVVAGGPAAAVFGYGFGGNDAVVSALALVGVA
jgi:hypothetical protein